MKLLMIVFCMVLTGCVGTIVSVKPEPLELKIYRLAIFYRVDVPSINKDGIKGYSGKNDTKAIKATIEGAVNAASATMTKGVIK